MKVYSKHSKKLANIIEHECDSSFESDKSLKEIEKNVKFDVDN